MTHAPLVLFPLEIALLSRKGCDVGLLLLVKSGVVQWVPVTKTPSSSSFLFFFSMFMPVCVQLHTCVGALKGQR